MGLYYPYVHFRSDEWLKLAALYWPKMARMVPANYPVRDSETVRVLAGELDFVLDIDPRQSAKAIAPVFEKVIRKHRDALRARYGISVTRIMDSLDPALIGNGFDPHLGGFFGKETWRQGRGILFEGEPHSPYVHGSADELTGTHAATSPLTGLCVDQVWPSLRRRMVDSGLAVEHDYLQPWLGVHSEFAWVYTCILADSLAQSNRLTLATDQTATHAFRPEWTEDSVAAALLQRAPSEPDGNLVETIGTLAVQLVTPTNLSHIPAKKIVEIRRRYAVDFDAFGEAVNSLASSIGEFIAGVQDEATMSAYIESAVEREFANKLKKLHQDLTQINISQGLTALSSRFDIPATALAVGAGLLVHQPVIAGAGAIGFGLLQLRHGLRSNRLAKLTPTPASYLLRVENHLTPRNLLGDIADGLARVIGLRP